jgi:hypothetical protein
VKHNRSFDAISSQLSDKRFIVTAAGGLFTLHADRVDHWLQFWLRLLCNRTEVSMSRNDIERFGAAPRSRSANAA